MRRDPWLVALSLAVFFVSLGMSIDWLARAALTPSRPSVVLVFLEGLLAVVSVGVVYFAFTYRPFGVGSSISASALVRAIAMSSFGAVLFIALFCAAALFITPAVGTPTPVASLKSLNPPTDKPPVAWTQFSIGEPTYVIARTLIDLTGKCPSIDVDGDVRPMRERPDPRSATFGRLCERRIAWEHKDLHIRISSDADVLLDHTIRNDPKTMTVMGDTGCRVASHEDQGCLSDAEWPFGLVADSAARMKSDLIIHVGDYFYREASCKRSSVACHHRAFGDREEGWRTDFFEPARELLNKAPWIFVRGNHEDCQRGGYGWFYYFGSNSVPCEAAHDTTYLPFVGVLVMHLDTSHADDSYAYEILQPKWSTLESEIKAGGNLPVGNTPILLLTHKPIYARCTDKVKDWSGCDTNRKDAITVANLHKVREIVQAVQATGRRTIILGGDIHTFQVTDATRSASAPGMATQVIVGNGGSGLDTFNSGGSPLAPTPFWYYDYELNELKPAALNAMTDKWDHKVVPGGPLMAMTQVWPQFGFGLLTFASPNKIELAVHDKHGKPQFTCDLASMRTSALVSPTAAGAPPLFTPATPRCR